ncbi:MAG: EAL domain-containing protein [Coxiellaceae bacterium]|nr:EAL domain-containing protein [Coxiellaceae bacterium]
MRKLEHIAHYDTLTKIPNRFHFERVLEKTLANAERYKRQFAVMFLDIDHFKFVNDTFGHHVGDQLLQEAVVRIGLSLRDGDLLARLGGDEFAVIVPEFKHGDDLSIVARKIIESLEPVFTIAGKEFHITISIGIACYPEVALSTQEIMSKADMALYSVKEAGRNAFQFFHSETDKIQKRRMLIEKELHFAIERNEMHLVYQPKIDLKTKKIAGLEVLLRWNNEELGCVSPSEFIPIAESSGLILPIGDWVIDRACKQQADWIKDKFGPYPMAVNFSARQLMQRNLVHDLKEKLLQYEIPPGFFQVELTETALMDNEWEHGSLFNELHRFGIHLTIDDFGTGYSSFERLKALPIQSIKVDISFIRRVNLSQQDAVIVRSILSLAKGLNLLTIAEGVEEKAQADFLIEEGCDQVQGFYYAKPLPAHKWEAFISEYSEEDMGLSENYGMNLCERVRKIAHDINNVLTGIQGYADLLLRKYNTDEQAANEHLKQIKSLSVTLCNVMQAVSEDIIVIQHKDALLDANDILNISQIAHYTACECDSIFSGVEAQLLICKDHVSIEEGEKILARIQKLLGDGMFITQSFRHLLDKKNQD